jgi:hypothetical protein
VVVQASMDTRLQVARDNERAQRAALQRERWRQEAMITVRGNPDEPHRL